MSRLVLIWILVAVVVGCTSARPSPTPSAQSTPAGSQAPSASSDATLAPGTIVPASEVPPTDQPTPGTTEEPTSSVVPSDGPPQTPPPSTTAPSGSFDPDGIRLALEPFASGFARLTFVTHAGDGTGTLYAVEQPGRIVPVTPGDVQGAPLLDITDRVGSGGERGLLGLAFHPDFESNGRFFVNYTNKQGNTVVSEFVRGASGTVDAAAERVLLRVNQPYPNHNGGMVAFGSDGYLYIGLGDGGSAGDPHNNGQRLDTHLGKILRIDVNSGDPYGIPQDNPFANGQDGALPEIWSLGQRNPWRFSFDRATGAMFIADVGQNEFEEINAEPAGVGGRNYGWKIMEADRCYANEGCSRRGLTLPVAIYSHSEGCSVTGGYVYRGGAFPQLFGGYVFSDYCSGRLWALNAQRALDVGSAQIIDLGEVGFSPSAFGEDEAGELYVVNHNGSILRLVALPR